MPRSHLHEVGLPDDESANFTTNGAQPAFGDEVKSAVNCAVAPNPLKIKEKISGKNLPILVKAIKKLGFFKDKNFWNEKTI